MDAEFLMWSIFRPATLQWSGWYNSMATSVQYNDDVYLFGCYSALATLVQYNGDDRMRVESRLGICASIPRCLSLASGCA